MIVIRLWRTMHAVWLLAGVGLVLGGCGRPGVQSSPGGRRGGVSQAREVRAGGRGEGARGASLATDPPADSAQKVRLRERARSANLVICIIDAARADHIGCYGYPRETTPNIDRLAAESVLFEQHFAPYPHTKPSTVSLFTSLYPDTHLVAERRAMDPHIFSMANALESAGFQSAFLSSGPMASPVAGVGRDFEFICARDRMKGRGGMRRSVAGARRGSWQGSASWRTPRSLVGALCRWLDEERTGRFLAYVHFLPPHIPYSAPEEMQALFAGKEPPNAWQGDFEFREVAQKYDWKPLPLHEWVNSYDANLRWADWAVGEVVKALRERDLLQHTLLVVTSDHGEAFGEHGYRRHIYGVYDELVHVPLLVRFPGAERIAGRVGALTQTVDVLPTVLDLFGIAGPEEEMQGRSLLPLVTGEVERVRDYVYATCAGETPSYLVRDHDWALILWEGGKLRALYDLRNDPRQTRNVIEEQPGVAARMVNAFRRFAAGQRLPPLEFVDPEAKRGKLPPAPQVEFTEEQRKELRALGYVE